MGLRGKVLHLMSGLTVGLTGLLYGVFWNLVGRWELVLSLLLAGLVFGLAVMVLMERSVLARVLGLRRELKRIGAGGDLSARVRMAGRDELADLARTFNDTMEVLERSEQGRLDIEKRYQRDLQILASKQSQMEEQTRKRTAMELHENLGQLLALARIKLGSIRQESENPVVKESLKEVQRLLEQTLRFTRSVTAELCPLILYELGLEAGMEWLLERIQSQSHLQTAFHKEGADLAIAETQRIFLFQASRELLANVVKHAAASRVDVTVHRNPESIQVTVEDDGIGFDLAGPDFPPRRRNGFGLFGIGERIRLMDGRMDIRSVPGHGTRILLRVPREVHKEPVPSSTGVSGASHTLSGVGSGN